MSTQPVDYRIQHITTYTYDDEVTGSYGQYHLRPKDTAWQQLKTHDVTIDPAPAEVRLHSDQYGNTKCFYHVLVPHTVLTITSVSTVQVAPPQLDEELLALPWEQARPSVADADDDAWRALDFTFPSPMVDIPDAIRDYALASFTSDRPIGEAAVDLMHRVHADFTYKSGATTVQTRVADLMTNKTGVCQDFSHFMVSCLRSIGLGGRYVSGYLATRPPPGRPRLVGADASHAWVGVWVPKAGWLDLDPTNNRRIDASHATVAWGRDYSDVPPVKGVIFSEAKKSKLKVSVDMAALEA
jgi:transglutaminase-like putative cysteine protease